MGTSPSEFATATQTLAAALYSATFDPADAIRLLKQLGTYTPNMRQTTSPIGMAVHKMQRATGDLFRRSAIIAMARAAATYQPASYDDAVDVRNKVCDALEIETIIAADQAEDDVYEALRTLKTAIAADLKARGADLARVRTYHVQAPQPSLALAHKLYNKINRATELEIQAEVVHPLFMPPSFKGLTA